MSAPPNREPSPAGDPQNPADVGGDPDAPRDLLDLTVAGALFLQIPHGEGPAGLLDGLCGALISLQALEERDSPTGDRRFSQTLAVGALAARAYAMGTLVHAMAEAATTGQPLVASLAAVLLTYMAIRLTAESGVLQGVRAWIE